MDSNSLVNKPINQLNLYGYQKYFELFIKLNESKTLPKCILLNGPKGLGKSTFAYHLSNYFLSKDEECGYSLDNFLINDNSNSYNFLLNKTHPNFYLIDFYKDLDKSIKIEQIRDLLIFARKSTFSKNLKLILIDNAEFLNLNSSNSLLKILEEPPDNTIFLIVHDSAVKLLSTIKSRCSEFKIHFTFSQKREILIKILEQYKFDLHLVDILDEFYFDTPGNLIKYISILDKEKLNYKENKIGCIDYFMELYKKLKDPNLLNFISIFVTNYYNNLCIKNPLNQNLYFFNNFKIIQKLNEIKIYNSNEKSIFFLLRIC